MSCGPVTYKGITPAVLNCLRAAAQHAGVSLPYGDAGTVHGQGYTVNYVLDHEGQKLTIIVTDMPARVTCEEVFTRAKTLIGNCGGS